MQSKNFNFTNTPSLRALNQIKHLQTKKEKLDSDTLIEIVKYREIQLKKGNNFIREISMVSLRIFLVHQEALQIIKLEIKNKNFLSFHLDCTGSLFNKYKNKHPYYYSICLPSKQSPISNHYAPPVTIGDAILTDHSTPSIKCWLGKILHLIEQTTNKSLKLDKIEVDFSWAFLHAAIETFNKVDTKTYIQRSFNILNKTKKISSFSHFTPIHLCSSHVIKAISTNLSKITKSKQIKKTFLYCFARMQNTTNLEKAQDFFFHVVIVFISKYQDEQFKHSLNIINDHINNPDNIFSNIHNNLSPNENSETESSDDLKNFFTNFDEGLCKGYFNYPFLITLIQFSVEQSI